LDKLRVVRASAPTLPVTLFIFTQCVLADKQDRLNASASQSRAQFNQAFLSQSVRWKREMLKNSFPVQRQFCICFNISERTSSSTKMDVAFAKKETFSAKTMQEALSEVLHMCTLGKSCAAESPFPKVSLAAHPLP
jgi:hypothetical protein